MTKFSSFIASGLWHYRVPKVVCHHRRFGRMSNTQHQDVAFYVIAHLKSQSPDHISLGSSGSTHKEYRSTFEMWLLNYICISEIRHLKTSTIQTVDFGLFLYHLHLTL